MEKPSGRSWLIFTVVVLTFLLPLVFTGGIVVGSDAANGIVFSPDSLSSWVSAAATAAIALLTFVLAKETWYLREAQIEQVDQLRRESMRPAVSFHLVNSKISWNLFEIEVLNHGRGIARNIRFRLLDREGQPITAEESVMAEKLCALHAIREGLETLRIGEEFRSFVFSAMELGSEREKRSEGGVFQQYLRVEVQYEDVEGNPYSNSYVIDLARYRGVTHLGGADPLYKLANEVEKIQMQLPGLGSGSRRLEVNSYTEEDRKRERTDVLAHPDELSEKLREQLDAREAPPEP